MVNPPCETDEPSTHSNELNYYEDCHTMIYKQTLCPVCDTDKVDVNVLICIDNNNVSDCGGCVNALCNNCEWTLYDIRANSNKGNLWCGWEEYVEIWQTVRDDVNETIMENPNDSQTILPAKMFDYPFVVDE